MSLQRTPSSRSAVSLVIILAGVVAQRSALAQDPDSSAAVSLDSADVIRASLKRPPPRPPFEALDLVTLPFRIIALPVRAVSWGFSHLVGAVTVPGEPPRLLVSLRDAGFRVGFGTIGPRSGIAGKLGFWGARPLFLEGAYSIRASYEVRGGLRFDDFRGRSLEIGYTNHRDSEPHFWGVGPDTEVDDRTDYLFDWQKASVFAQTRLATLRFISDLGWEDNEVGRGKDGKRTDLQDTAFDTLFGVNERVRYFRASLTPILDLTRQVKFQRRGVSIAVGASIFRGVNDTDSDFHRFTLDIRGYLPLNDRQNFAFKIISEINREDGGQGIPFYHLASLGSRRGVRSLRTDRFRDRDMAALMTEWRFEVWRELHERIRAESFVFFDIGGVDHTITDLRLRDTRQSFGFGYRVTTPRGGEFLTYLAFGDEGPKFRVSFSTAYLP